MGPLAKMRYQSLAEAYLWVNFQKVSLINCLELYKFAKTWN